MPKNIINIGSWATWRRLATPYGEEARKALQKLPLSRSLQSFCTDIAMYIHICIICIHIQSVCITCLYLFIHVHTYARVLLIILPLRAMAVIILNILGTLLLIATKLAQSLALRCVDPSACCVQAVGGS